MNAIIATSEDGLVKGHGEKRIFKYILLILACVVSMEFHISRTEEYI